MGGPNPKYQQFHGLWAVRFTYDHEVGLDYVVSVFPIESSRSYWACDMDRMTDIHSSEESARESEKRVSDVYYAKIESIKAEIKAEIDWTGQQLRKEYAGRGWFNSRSDEDIRAVAEYLTKHDKLFEVDEDDVKVLFGLEE